MKRVGILALQGAFVEHEKVLSQLGVEVQQVRLPAELDQIDGLIIPGGESTTIGKLATHYGLVEPLKAFAASQRPLWGVCAGLIFMARDIGDLEQPLLGLMDIAVRRNAFGRQVNSFETDLQIPVLNGFHPNRNGQPAFHAIFIRGPVIESTGPGVEVLARLHDGGIVAARQRNLLVTAFHPELSGDPRLHEYFLKMIDLSASLDHS
jgi:5'-phosphate synthase pdxT subunit